MKGMFAWTNPQLVFLFELLQAHRTYLKCRGGELQTFSEEQYCDNFEFVFCSPVFGSFSLNLNFVLVDWKQTIQTTKVQNSWKKTTVANICNKIGQKQQSSH